MDMSFLKGEPVNTGFPGEPNPKAGIVIDGAGPWQVRVRWDDGTVSDIHSEDVIFDEFMDA
jgi:hypothetical protein